jgi:hypothetical protein
MLKYLFTSFLILIVAGPAFAKPKDVYPVSCADLWVAVKDTLDNPGNYGIMSISDSTQQASFIVVGNLTQYTDRIALTAKDGGCAMKESFLEVGSDNGDLRQFNHRVEKSLAKVQAAKPKQAPTAAGQL